MKRSMKRKPFVIIDCDDVLVSCNEYALQLLNAEDGSNFQLGDIDRWGLMGNGLDRRLKFFHDPEFVGSQPVYPGAKDFIDQLKKMAYVRIVTAVPQICVAAREDFLRRNFAGTEFEVVSDKANIESDIMLDDSVTHLRKAKTHLPVVFKRPWNMEEQDFLSVSTYSSFLALVREVTANV